MDVAQGKRILSAVEQAGIKNQLNLIRYYPAVSRAPVDR
jgi:hypothetical protein